MKKKMSFPEFYKLQSALMLIERVIEYRQNILSEYGFSASSIDGLVAIETEHRLKSLYAIRNSLIEISNPARSKVDLLEFDKRCEEREKLREERRKKEGGKL